MVDTLTPHSALAKLGDMLMENCPKNDCLIYRSTYEQYREAKADYTRIVATFSDLSTVTTHALEHCIRQLIIGMGRMWIENYDVGKYRDIAGVSGRKEMQ